jgi:hypothetical protein
MEGVERGLFEAGTSSSANQRTIGDIVTIISVILLVRATVCALEASSIPELDS